MLRNRGTMENITMQWTAQVLCMNGSNQQATCTPNNVFIKDPRFPCICVSAWFLKGCPSFYHQYLCLFPGSPMLISLGTHPLLYLCIIFFSFYTYAIFLVHVGCIVITLGPFHNYTKALQSSCNFFPASMSATYLSVHLNPAWLIHQPGGLSYKCPYFPTSCYC